MDENQEAVSLIQKLVKKGTSPADGMRELCDFAESRHSHSAWKKLRRLDYGEDVRYLEKWLNHLLRTEPPGADIEGLYFGLIESENSYVLYASGADHYDPKDADWACDPAWWPDNRYAWSPILLEKMHPIVKRMPSDPRLLAEYCLWLGYSVLAVAHLCRTLDPRLLLGNRKRRAVTVGFDAGDYVDLPMLEKARKKSR